MPEEYFLINILSFVILISAVANSIRSRAKIREANKLLDRAKLFVEEQMKNLDQAKAIHADARELLEKIKGSAG